MSPDQEHRLEEIFSAVRDLPPLEQSAFLARACGSDAELRRQVDSLLEAHEQAGQFLQPTVALSTPNAPVEKPGDRIGRYKLLEQIGEGGFGVVWMAEQEEPVRRRVALKIIKLGMDTKEVVARFEAERQALAMMDYPNIAIVFDGGATDTGRPYFVMELVKGVPITDYCDANRLSTSERLELFMQVCQAVQHAHQKGVIHRDLKPSNILVTVKDDRPVPKVIDFGVAKATQARLTEKTVFTRFRQWIGTPSYMSPEQAGLGSLDVDTRSDIYSLGVLLYELLTGRTPFDTQKLLAAGYDAVMRTIREVEPPKPSTRLSTLAVAELNVVAAKRGSEPAKLNRLVRGDLDWIVMKALEKDRTRRYEATSDFAQDLDRYLRQEPVSAVAPSVGYRLTKFVRRNRVTLAMTSAVFAFLATGTMVSTWEAVRATRAEKSTGIALDSAKEANAATEAGKRKIEAALYASRVSTAYQAWEKGDAREADELLDLCPADLREWEWHYLKRQCHLELASFSVMGSGKASVPEASAELLGGGHVVNFHAQVAFLPNGKEVVARLANGPFARFDIASAKLIPWVWPPATNAEVLLAAGGARLVGLPKNGPIAQVLDLSSGKAFLVRGEPVAPERLVSDDGGWLAIQVTNGAEVVALAPDPPRRFIGITNRFRRLHSLSPDGATLVTEGDGGYGVWESASGRLRFKINVPAYPHHFRFDSRGKLLAVCGPLDPDYQQRGFSIAVWNIASGRCLFTLSNQSIDSLTKMWFSRDAEWLVVAASHVAEWRPSVDVKVVDTTTGAEVFAVVADNLSHHPGRAMWIGKPGEGGAIFSVAGVRDVALSPDGKLLALAVCDRTVHLIRLDPSRESGSIRWPVSRTVLRGHRGAVLAVSFSPDGQRLASMDQLGVVKVWDPASQLSVALGRDWENYATVSPDATTVLWTDLSKREDHALNLTTGERTTLPEFPVVDHRQIRILDESRIAVRGQVWSVPARGPIMTFSTNEYIEHLASTEDGRYVATIGDGVRLWETSIGKPVGEPIPIDNESFGRPYPYHQGSRLLSITSDGRKVAACAEGKPNVVQVWRTGVGGDTPGLITSFPGRKPLLFGPNGAWLLAGKAANTFQCVDATTGKVLRDYKLRSRMGSRRLREEQFEFTLLGWELSPNGRFAICFDFDADLPIVDLSSSEVVFEAGWPVLGAWAAFTPDGRRALIPGRDQRLGIWSLETKSRIVTLPETEVFIRFTRDGNRAVVINPDGQLSVLDGTPLETKKSTR